MTKKLAIFPGSFDPLTNGHVSILTRGLSIFDEILVAVTINISKAAFFSVEERMGMIQRCFPEDPRITIESLEGLLAHYARERGACAILRGLRAPSDFEYELQMSQMNRHLNDELETVFLSAEAKGSYISSSLVKEVAALGGDVTSLVPAHVAEALGKRFS
jgi:pantetheine-phosphate adenylyltransferase